MGIRMQYTLSGRLCNKSLKEDSLVPHAKNWIDSR